MDRYNIFRKLMGFFDCDSEITDAAMNDYCGRITITAKSGNQTIKVMVTLSEEEEQHAEEV